jgi:hypothetical protein
MRLREYEPVSPVKIPNNIYYSENKRGYIFQSPKKDKKKLITQIEISALH